MLLFLDEVDWLVSFSSCLRLRPPGSSGISYIESKFKSSKPKIEVGCELAPRGVDEEGDSGRVKVEVGLSGGMLCSLLLSVM